MILVVGHFSLKSTYYSSITLDLSRQSFYHGSMTASKVINQQVFKDGKIVLYQLADRPKKLWLCRIKVPKNKGYVYRGTGTSDLFEARRFAEELLEEFLIKIKLGQSITGHNLSKMVEEYESHINAKGEPTKRELAILAFLNTYAVPYFTKNKITELTTGEIARFFDWRRQNSMKKAPKMLVGVL